MKIEYQTGLYQINSRGLNMDEITYVDDLGHSHIISVSIVGYIGLAYIELTYNGRIFNPHSHWIKKSSIPEWLRPLELSGWYVTDLNREIQDPDRISYDVYNYMRIDQLVRNMHMWIPHIHPDLVNIVIAYAFDIGHVPKAALKSQ